MKATVPCYKQLPGVTSPGIPPEVERGESNFAIVKLGRSPRGLARGPDLSKVNCCPLFRTAFIHRGSAPEWVSTDWSCVNTKMTNY